MPLMGLKTDKLYLPWTRITEVPAGVGGDPNWANVQGKPTTLAGFGLDAETASLVNSTSVGSGHVMQDVTASRAAATTYTNTTGRPIQVEVSVHVSAGQGFVIKKDGVNTQTYGNDGAVANTFSVSCLVLPGQTYRIEFGGGTLTSWFESR